MISYDEPEILPSSTPPSRPISADGRHRFFNEGDTFGWYLFQAEASLDHVWNYEAAAGSRVVPVLKVIGRDLGLLADVGGLDRRVRRLVGSERRQPNGGLFELLVAAAYRRAGAKVDFLDEIKGGPKTHDMDVTVDGRTYAVECKRMETSDYGDRERMRMRELWGPSSAWLCRAERSTFCDVRFSVPVEDVPADYLTSRTKRWLGADLPSLLWEDEIGSGAIGDLDPQPLQDVLRDHQVVYAGTRILELLSGRYRRHENFVQVMRVLRGDTPRYVADCDLAVLLRWESKSSVAVDAKARDVVRKLADANGQLPDDRPGIVHIGFEAVEGDDVERRRFEKIVASTSVFDPRSKPLEYVFVHYLVLESPPVGAWIMDETAQCRPIHPTGPPPVDAMFLTLPPGSRSVAAPFWDARLP